MSERTPGVYVFQRTHPSGVVTWRGKWRDPDSGKWRFVSLTRLGVEDCDSARAAWRRRMLNRLERRRTELLVNLSGDPE